MNEKLNKLAVRTALLSDMGGVTEIYADAVKFGLASFELQPPVEVEMTRRFRHLVDAGYPYLVAHQQDEIAGYCYVGPYRTRPAYQWSVENSVYVSENWQGRGVGKRLLSALIEACEGLNFRQMIAVIGDSANIASIKLHESAGFKPAGILKNVGRKRGRWLDSVTMQLALGPGAAQAPKREPE